MPEPQKTKVGGVCPNCGKGILKPVTAKSFMPSSPTSRRKNICGICGFEVAEENPPKGNTEKKEGHPSKR